MDKLGQALKLLDKALAELDRPAVLSHRVPQCALWLATAAVLVLVDIAVSLREMLGYEEVANADNQT